MSRESTTNRWLLFLANLSGGSASTPRVRLWRAMKDVGAGTVRDGVAVLPARDGMRDRLNAIRGQVEADGGTAWLLELAEQRPEVESALCGLFDRADACRDLETEVASLRTALPALDEAGARRRFRQLERDTDALRRIDYFPGPASEEVAAALGDLAALINRRYSPEEPSSAQRDIARLDREPFQARTWATRRRPWVDRIASAWLIRRFIDPQARFLWLERPDDCPSDAVGFDFDGATFTHAGERVTFEVLLASFSLESQAGLVGLGRLVHYLDVGGVPVPEAPGFEAVLAGLRDAFTNDDELLDVATPVLDALHRRFAMIDA